MRDKFPLIIAIICGILAILLLNVYLRHRENEIWERVKEAQKKMQPVMPPPERTGVVLVASREISPQTPIMPEDLLIKEMPIKYIQPGALASLDMVIGQISSTPIAAGEQILTTKLLPPGKIGKTLSEITPEGKRALTISVDDFSNISGLLKPGDLVDVLALLTPPSGAEGLGRDSNKPQVVPLFQGIEVLAVGSEFYTTPKDRMETSARSGYDTGTVTLALKPQEAILLSFVQDQGKIKLVMRSAEDVKIEPVRTADWDLLFQYLYPSPIIRQPEPTTEGVVPTIEIYRGLRRDFIPISEEAQ